MCARQANSPGAGPEPMPRPTRFGPFSSFTCSQVNPCKGYLSSRAGPCSSSTPISSSTCHMHSKKTAQCKSQASRAMMDDLCQTKLIASQWLAHVIADLSVLDNHFTLNCFMTLCRRMSNLRICSWPFSRQKVNIANRHVRSM